MDGGWKGGRQAVARAVSTSEELRAEQAYMATEIQAGIVADAGEDLLDAATAEAAAEAAEDASSSEEDDRFPEHTYWKQVARAKATAILGTAEVLWARVRADTPHVTPHHPCPPSSICLLGQACAILNMTRNSV